MAIAVHINAAFAQFALFGFSFEPNAHTNIITNPTRGIAAIKIVMIQSFTDTTCA
jgi:hypothetical protein